MAFSIFSKKQPSEKETEGEAQKLLGLVRTMKDDLDEARYGKRQAPSSPAEKQTVEGDLLQRGAFQKTVNPFSEEGGKAIQAEARTGGEQSGSPFGAVPRYKNGPASNVPQYPSLKNGLSGLVSDGGGMITNHPKKGMEVFWVSLIWIFAIALVSGGVFYFFFQKNQEETLQPLSLDVPSNIPSDVPEEVAGQVSQDDIFALDKPNYLSFNTETVSPEDIKNTLLEVALRVKSANITQPVEFLVTDQNNNPLAFSRFAFLLKLDPASDVVALVNETFSLYIYNDASRMHLGLGLTFKDAPAAISAITETETALPDMFQALILESDIPVSKVTPFHSGDYNQFSVRFANVNESRNVSFDYTFYGNQWFIGTSKNTLRAILDMYVK
jgi:hypothetical protein